MIRRRVLYRPVPKEKRGTPLMNAARRKQHQPTGEPMTKTITEQAAAGKQPSAEEAIAAMKAAASKIGKS